MSSGAFKHLPFKQQPVRIPVAKIPQIQKALLENFSSIGELHFVDEVKKAGTKPTVGDIDVLFIATTPFWKTVLKKSKFTVAIKSNCVQSMTVMKDLCGDGAQYMIDFLYVKPGCLEFKKLFYGYGTPFSALLGSFARSIGYKFTDFALFRRAKDHRDQWHNYKLTSDPTTALQILGLDSSFINDDALYTIEGLAAWIVSSPRFDSNLWNNGHPDKNAVGIPINKNARDAIKKQEHVEATYDLICSTEKVGDGICHYLYERTYLGNDFVDKLINDINKDERDSNKVLSGDEVMKILDIPPGPDVGDILKYLSRHFKDAPDAARIWISQFKDVNIVKHELENHKSV